MSSLYDIQADYLEIINELEESGGEITEELGKKLEINEEEFENKAEAYVHVIKELESKNDSIDKEIKRLRKRKKVTSNTISRLEEALSTSLSLREEDKYETDLFTLSFRKSSGVNVFDEDKIPEEYFRVKRSPSLSDIKKAIEEGKEIEGAEIEERQNLQIR